VTRLRLGNAAQPVTSLAEGSLTMNAKEFWDMTCEERASTKTLTLLKIIEHGRETAIDWLNDPDDRAYWQARFSALQWLFRDVTAGIGAYGFFDDLCGVVWENGHIKEVKPHHDGSDKNGTV